MISDEGLIYSSIGRGEILKSHHVSEGVEVLR